MDSNTMLTVTVGGASFPCRLWALPTNARNLVTANPDAGPWEAWSVWEDPATGKRTDGTATITRE